MRLRAVLASAVVIAGALVGLSAAPASACTCGALLGSGGAVASPETRAIVSWADGVETIELATTARSASGTVGLIVPTPARASVSAGDPDLFAQLDHAILPKQIVEDDWWGRGSDPEVAPTVEPVTAQVASTRARVGDAKAVSSWATKHQLRVDAATSSALDGYAHTGWSLSLVTLTGAHVGDQLAPVKLTFKTKLVVYPMLLAASSSAPVDLRVYALGDHRSTLVQHTRATPALDAAESVVWAGPTSGGPAASLAPYLTVIDVHLDDPAVQVASDVRIVDAVSDDPYIPERLVVNRIAVFGLPLGWVLSVWAGLGIIAGLAALAARLRAR